MATVPMSEAEVARDLHAVLAKVQQGVEVVIEQDHRPIAVLGSSVAPRPGRKLSECIAMAKAYESMPGDAPLPDADFAGDVQAGIDARLTRSSRPHGNRPRLHCADRSGTGAVAGLHGLG